MSAVTVAIVISPVPPTTTANNAVPVKTHDNIILNGAKRNS